MDFISSALSNRSQQPGGSNPQRVKRLLDDPVYISSPAEPVQPNEINQLISSLREQHTSFQNEQSQAEKQENLRLQRQLVHAQDEIHALNKKITEMGRQLQSSHKQPPQSQQPEMDIFLLNDKIQRLESEKRLLLVENYELKKKGKNDAELSREHIQSQPDYDSSKSKQRMA